MKFWTNLIILFLLIFFPEVGDSQNLLTPEMAIAIAKEKSYSLKIAENQYKIAQNNNTKSNAGKFANLNLTASETPSLSNLYQKLSNGSEISRDFALANNFGVNLNYAYPLYDGGRSSNALERLGIIAEQQKDNINNTNQNLISATLNAYFKVVKQKQLIRFAQEQLLYLEEIARITMIKSDLGKTNDIEVLQSKSDVLNQKLTISRSQIELKNIVNLLYKTLNEDAAKDYQVLDSIVLEKRTFKPEFANPLIAYLEKQNKINELIKAELKSTKKPRINLLSSLSINRTDQQAGFLLLSQNLGVNLGLQATYNILDGGNINRQIENITIEIENNKLNKQLIYKDLDAELNNQILKYESEWSALQNQKQVVNNNREIYKIALERFKLGRTTILDLARYLRNYDESYFNYLNNIYNIKQAEISIQAVIGF
jgi:outer membrane protein